MSVTAEQFFADYTPGVATLAMQARGLLLDIMPGATEKIDNGNKVVHYGSGAKMAQQVFYISAHKAHVNIGLRGANLQDAHGIMEGTGKQLRHVKLRKLEDLENPALRALLLAALAGQYEPALMEETRGR